MTKEELIRRLKLLRSIDREEFVRTVVGGVIQLEVKLRNEGADFETEFGGEVYEQ